MTPIYGDQAMDDEFSRAQMNLPFKDRNAINEEIHCVGCMAPQESPALLRAALYQLNQQLDRIEDKPAYNRAQQMYTTNSGAGRQYGYINTDDFRLRFLRCALFDAKKAAARMVKYLDLVCDAYGPYALTRPFKLSDLSKAEMSFLRGGDYQLMPYRDRSGRRVMCIVTNNRDDVSPKTRLKILIYLYVVAAEDVESQRRGMVIVSYSGPKITIEEEKATNSNLKKFHQSRMSTHVTVGAAIPLRLVAIHLCFPDTTFTQILTKIYGIALWTMDNNISARVKVHSGQSIELRYKLKGYGIPTELIPSTDTGNVKHVNLKQWIKLRDFLENNSFSSGSMNVPSGSDDAMDYEVTGSSMGQDQLSLMPIAHYPKECQQQQLELYQRTQIVECPGANDVVFRRGKSMTYHPGNVMFQSLIESRIEEHTQANQVEKLSIVKSLIQYIRDEKGGRFLTWDSKNNWWLNILAIPMSGVHNTQNRLIDAQELEIQSKVNYAFRDFKKKLKTQNNLQIIKSSTNAFKHQDGSKQKRHRPNTIRSSLDGCFGSDSDTTK